jgi:hypothetical protein
VVVARRHRRYSLHDRACRCYEGSPPQVKVTERAWRTARGGP